MSVRTREGLGYVVTSTSPTMVREGLDYVTINLSFMEDVPKKWRANRKPNAIKVDVATKRPEELGRQEVHMVGQQGSLPPIFNVEGRIQCLMWTKE